MKSSDFWNMSRMNDGALLLGGCVALIGFLHKEITTELIESVCFRGCLAGYTPLLPVATQFRGCRVLPSRYRRQWLGQLYPCSNIDGGSLSRGTGDRQSIILQMNITDAASIAATTIFLRSLVMKICLVGKANEQKRFDEYANELRNHGFEVVSRWHESDQTASFAKRFQTIRDNQAQFVSKFMRITLGQNIAGEEITDVDRKSVAGGPSALEIDNAFRRFKSELSKADCVIADLIGASMEAGFALALGKRVVLIGDSNSPLIPYCIDKIKIVDDWDQAFGVLINLRGASLYGRRFDAT
jgi:hypothetical protein